MERKGMLNVFVSSTYRDLHAVRGLLIEGIEKALDTAAMERFVPKGDISAHHKSIEELEKSDICIFIIGDYYGTVIRRCNLEKPLCGDCSQRISFTHCEYRNALQNSKLHMVYILENRIVDVLSRIQKFDLATTGEVEIYNFLLRNGMDGSAVDMFSGYRLDEIKELWKISQAKYRKKQESFKKEVTGHGEHPKSYFPVAIEKRKDFLHFQNMVRSHLRENIVKWYKEGKITFADFAGRRNELEELLRKLHEKKSVCVVGTGGVGKTSLIQVALLLESLTGRKIYVIGKSYSHEHTRDGYQFARNRFEKATFNERLTLVDILNLVFSGHVRRENILKMEKNQQVQMLVEELDWEKSVLFVDDLQDAEDEVKQVVYACGNLLNDGAVVAGVREKGNCYSCVGPLAGLSGKDLQEMVRILVDSQYPGEYDNEKLEHWSSEVFRITQGHPLLVDIMVKNMHRLSDDVKLKGITGVTSIADQNNVEEVMNRLIREILTDEEMEGILVMSVFRLPMYESIMERAGKGVVYNIIDKGFLQWVGGKLVFTFEAVRELLEMKAPKECHEIAVNYYRWQFEELKENEKPTVYTEIIHHLVSHGNHEEALNLFLQGSEILERERKRAIEIGRILLETVIEKKKRARLLGGMGNLLLKGGEFGTARKAYTEALGIYRKLAQKDPGAYESYVATTLNNLGNLYSDLREFKKAEESYTEALGIRRKLAQKDPGAYESDVAMTLNNLG
ncbi:MAG: DUF4062 domain-containing protein, partial [Candidatus Methanofastidiosia archaeon]